MAETPHHITIKVDEEALRQQVHGVIDEAIREAAMRLRRAADALDPGWLKEHSDWLRADIRAEIEREAK